MPRKTAMPSRVVPRSRPEVVRTTGCDSSPYTAPGIPAESRAVLSAFLRKFRRFTATLLSQVVGAEALGESA
jgi:hypothetical protein